MLKKKISLYVIALLIISINVLADESNSAEQILFAKSNIEEITVFFF